MVGPLTISSIMTMLFLATMMITAVLIALILALAAYFLQTR